MPRAGGVDAWYSAPVGNVRAMSYACVRAMYGGSRLPIGNRLESPPTFDAYNAFCLSNVLPRSAISPLVNVEQVPFEQRHFKCRSTTELIDSFSARPAIPSALGMAVLRILMSLSTDEYPVKNIDVALRVQDDLAFYPNFHVDSRDQQAFTPRMIVMLSEGPSTRFLPTPTGDSPHAIETNCRALNSLSPLHSETACPGNPGSAVVFGHQACHSEPPPPFTNRQIIILTWTWASPSPPPPSHYERCLV